MFKTHWAIEPTAFKSVMDIIDKTDFNAISKKSFDSLDNPNENVLSVKDGVAQIPVKGVLSKESPGGFFRMLFGASSSYLGIVDAISQAENNPEVKSILLDIDSPGGSVIGAFDAAEAVRDAKKPVTAFINGLTASAAYLIASQADKIVAKNDADIVGSIGVLSRKHVSDQVIEITSTNAPNKSPDVQTQQGIDVVKSELDMMHNLMAEMIAKGRGVDVQIVNSEFGRGGVVTANIAVNRGMIDKSGDNLLSENNNNSGDISIDSNIEGSHKINKDDNHPTTIGGKNMPLVKMLHESPEAKKQYDAAIASAEADATSKERSRVKAHLSSLDHSKDIVIKAITEGAAYDQAAMATYMNAGIKATHGQDRSDDNADGIVVDGNAAGGGTDGGGTDKGEKMEADIAAHLKAGIDNVGGE